MNYTEQVTALSAVCGLLRAGPLIAHSVRIRWLPLCVGCSRELLVALFDLGKTQRPSGVDVYLCSLCSILSLQSPKLFHRVSDATIRVADRVVV